MKKIVFFGFGAVASVMACCLHELCSKYHEKIEFLFIVRNQKKAKSYLFRASHILKSSKFLVIKDFDDVFRNHEKYRKKFENADVLVNASTPKFNEEILKLAIKFKISYCDLASDMTKKLKFEQQKFHEQLKKSGIFGLINIGISPGVTNFIVGEKLMDIKKSESYIKINSINLYLLEQIDSEQVIFSWSPEVALEELEEKPRYIKEKKLVKIEPFSHSKIYEFPHFKGKVIQYPIYQEEILSFHDSFPEVNSFSISSGGSEVELIKNLYQLNLLSKRNIECASANMSVEQIVRRVLPGMKSPQKIEELQKKGVIKYAQFAAMAEIILEVKENKRKTNLVTETTGLSFHRYDQLLGTPYSGATYVSYPTGVGAAILLYYTYKSWEKEKQKFMGIIKAEELPSKIGEVIVNDIKREMSSYMIDFISHTHSFLKEK